MGNRRFEFLGLLPAIILILVGSVGLFPLASPNALSESDEIIGGLENYHRGGIVENPQSVYIRNRVTGDKKLIYTSMHQYIDRIAISPNREFFAGLEPMDSLSNRLVVINLQGSILQSIEDDVRLYTWAPKGYNIAYVTGHYHEDGESFRPTGLYVLDVNEGTKTKIAEKAYYLNWPAFDSCIYYNDLRHVYKYSPVTGITQETDYHGIGFSPDSKFYIALTSEDGPYLYVTDNNEEITARIKDRFGYLPQSWIPERDHHMLVVKVNYEPSFLDTVQSVRPRAYVANRKVRERLYNVYDVEKDQIVKEWIEKP